MVAQCTSGSYYTYCPWKDNYYYRLGLTLGVLPKDKRISESDKVQFSQRRPPSRRWWIDTSSFVFRTQDNVDSMVLKAYKDSLDVYQGDTSAKARLEQASSSPNLAQGLCRTRLTLPGSASRRGLGSLPWRRAKDTQSICAQFSPAPGPPRAPLPCSRKPLCQVRSLFLRISSLVPFRREEVYGTPAPAPSEDIKKEDEDDGQPSCPQPHPS